MLKSKIAMALAAAMVMAALYGCSSSDSGLKNDLKEAETDVTTLQGSLDAVAAELGLAAGSSEADILDALATATEDQLVTIRTALDLVADATAADIVTAIGMLDVDELVMIRTELDLAADATVADILDAIREHQPAVAADLKTEYLHEQAVVAGINAATRPDITTDITIAVDYALEASVTGLKEGMDGAPDADMSVQAMLTATDEGDDTTTTDNAFVYSNRSAPGDEEWNKYYDMDDRAVDGGTDNAPGMAVVDMVQGLNADGENEADADDIVTYRLEFADDVSSASALFVAAKFPSADQQTYNYLENPDDDADTMDDNRKFDGEFHGVKGEYECDDTCTAVTNEDSELTTFTGTWYFTPAALGEDDDPHMVTGVDEDNTYVYFGYWLQQVVDEDGDETIGVNHFSGGDAPIAVNDMGDFDCEGIASGMTCTASYSGKAGGKYAVKTLTEKGEVATLHTGQFVADVTLNAMFGGPTVAAVNHDRIEGDITGFNDAADNENRINHWEVELGAASTAESANGENVGATNDGMMDGTWTHTFYSRNAVDADTTGVSEEDMPPGNVAGVFDAHWSDGHAIGAYGAGRD